MGALRTIASFVKLEHTVFALPSAYAGMVLAAAGSPSQAVTVGLVVWVTLAMVGARTFAMALNRIIDARIDARNPRTAMRELPSGRLGRGRAWLLAAVALVLLVASTTQLDPVTRVLWPIPVALFLLYPYTKRFTWGCHLVLGLSIGLAPLAAWLATTGEAPAAAWLLALGFATWVAGFDIIYATTDVEFDRRERLHSIPVRFGVHQALGITRGLHVMTVGLLAGAGLLLELGVGWWLALGIAAGLLAWENRIVNADDLSRVDRAFFTVNSQVGVVLGVGAVLGLLG